jgi:hypothetical protein
MVFDLDRAKKIVALIEPLPFDCQAAEMLPDTISMIEELSKLNGWISDEVNIIDLLFENKGTTTF